MSETEFKRGRGRPKGSKNKRGINDQKTPPSPEPSIAPSADGVEFEPMINVETDSQFNNPVSDRESPLHQLPPSDNGDSNNYFDDSQVHDTATEEHYDSGGDSAEGEGGSVEEEAGGEKKDIPPHTKRKAIKKTAKMLGRFYAQILPAVPKRLAQIPEANLNRMSINGEIDLSSIFIFGMGTEMTIGEFVQQNNEKAEQTLIINDEQREEWEECLQDVLEEKQAALTPMQRLGVVTLMHTFALVGAAVELRMEMNASMAVFKEAHAQDRKKDHPDDNVTERERPAEGQQAEPVTATVVEEEGNDGGDDGTETYTAEEVYVQH